MPGYALGAREVLDTEVLGGLLGTGFGFEVAFLRGFLRFEGFAGVVGGFCCEASVEEEACLES